MPTLHIEHPITDFATWKAAFDRFAPAREASGVLHHRIQRPIDDPRYIVIYLDFDTDAEAKAKASPAITLGGWAAVRRNLDWVASVKSR
jgi:hypothetical protein